MAEPKKEVGFPHYEYLVDKRAKGHAAVKKFLSSWQLQPQKEHAMVDLHVIVTAMEALLEHIPKPVKVDEVAVLQRKVDILSAALREVLGDKEDEYALMGNEMPSEVQQMITAAKRGLEDADAAT